MQVQTWRAVHASRHATVAGQGQCPWVLPKMKLRIQRATNLDPRVATAYKRIVPEPTNPNSNNLVSELLWTGYFSQGREVRLSCSIRDHDPNPVSGHDQVMSIMHWSIFRDR